MIIFIYYPAKVNKHVWNLMIRSVIQFSTLVFLTFFLSGHPLIAQDTTGVQRQLNKAKTLYYDGQFEQAQNIILKLLSETKLNKEDQLHSLVLLAEIRRAINDEQGARKIIGRILDLKPDYNPSLSEYPPNFIKLVAEEKQKRHPASIQTKHAPWYKKPIYWAGMGGAAVLTTGVFLLTKKQETANKKLLPMPPDWPQTGSR